MKSFLLSVLAALTLGGCGGLPPAFSVVRVLARDDTGSWQGSAIPVDCIELSDGSYRVTFLTARHVVLNSKGNDTVERMWVNLFDAPNFQFAANLVPTRLIAAHPTMDVALFTARLNRPVDVLDLDYRMPVLSERVTAAGFSEGLSLSIGEGIISSLVWFWYFPDWEGAYQISAFYKAGASGGAILDSDGDVLGIIVGGWSTSEHINFFLPVLQVRDWIESVRYQWEPR